MERILVSGAHGFIGSHLCERLLASGHEVVALVSPWGDTANLAVVLDHPRLALRRADVTRPADLAGICRDVDAVVHAAAIARDWGPERPIMNTNVVGTDNLLTQAGEAGTSRFVLVSSVAVHRYSGFRDAEPESRPRDNVDMPYARSKIAAEDAVRAWAGEGVIVRPGLWPFGPRDPQLRRVATALRRRALPLVGGGSTVLNTCFVGNLTLGLELAATAPGVGGRTFVVADDGAPTWREVLTELAVLLGAPPPRLRLPPPLATASSTLVERVWAALMPRREPPLTGYRAALMRNDVHFSLEPARSTLGYRPIYSWQEGLRLSVSEDPLLAGVQSR